MDTVLAQGWATKLAPLSGVLMLARSSPGILFGRARRRTRGQTVGTPCFVMDGTLPGIDACARAPWHTVADVGQLVRSEDLHVVAQSLAMLALPDLYDAILRSPGWLSTLASQMMR